MKTNILLYGEARKASNELSSCDDLEAVLHVDLIAALSNALNRIAALEEQLAVVQSAVRQAANTASCLANGINPD